MTATETMEKFQSILAKNNNLVTKMGDLFRVVQNGIDLDGSSISDFTQRQEDARIIGKKIKDNAATAADILSRFVPDEEYLLRARNAYQKVVSFVSSTIPSSFEAGAQISAEVKFKNLGNYFSWDSDKNISLQVDLVDIDNNNLFSQAYPFDVNLSGNEPGDQLLNADYLQVKTFEIEMDFTLMIEGQYTLILQIKDLTYSFTDLRRLNVTVT